MFAPENANCPRVYTPRWGFNEAGACLPRKAAFFAAAHTGRGASMRPGHVCPGNFYPILWGSMG